LLIKAKQQHGKNENKNAGLFINCMDFVVVTKMNKKKSSYFFVMPWFILASPHTSKILEHIA
jgi:hypothetical protein